MCRNCFPYRDAACAHGPILGEPGFGPESESGLLAARISRKGMLKTVAGSLALAMAGGALSFDPADADATALPYVVLIVLDGARPEYFQIPGIPTVKSLMNSGTQFTNAFAGILESETPSGHTSIATGAEPRHHGILSFWWANGDNTKVDLFNPEKIRGGQMESIIRQSGTPTLAGLVHANHPHAKVVALSGSKYYAADALGGPDADVIMYFYGTSNGRFVPTYVPRHAPPAGVLSSPGLTTLSHGIPPGVENHLAMQLAIDTFSRMRQQVTLINLPEFDWPQGHVKGGILDHAGAVTRMHAFDHDLAMLRETYRKAGVLDRTLFVLMSDHGMMPLTHTIAKTDITNAVERAGTSIVTDAYESAIYLWVKDTARATAAAQNIVSLGNPTIQSVYVRTQTAKGAVYARVSPAGSQRAPGVEAANQYLMNSFNFVNSPDIVTVLAEGTGSEPGGQSGWKADHGGASWQAQHLPLIISGPGIRAGAVTPAPARLIDVAPTILEAMGITHHRMHGTALADAMRNPSAATARNRRSVIQQLTPIVNAMQQESRLEQAAKV